MNGYNTTFYYILTPQQLHSTLHAKRLSKVEVDQLVAHLLDHPALTGPLLQEVFKEDKSGTFNASWTFNHLMRKRLPYLLPVFDAFVQGLEHLTSDSCIRPMAHVCQRVTEAYFEKKNLAFRSRITEEQLEKLLMVCFDWLIGNYKTASKVFAMTSLYHLGQRFTWVPPELKQVLVDTIAVGSPGYQHRAKKTLDKLIALGY